MITLFPSTTQYFSEFTYFYCKDGGSLVRKACYPTSRIVPELSVVLNQSDPLIAQCQYGWSDNISHGLFDVISDFLILNQYFGVKYHEGRPILSALRQILESLGGVEFEGPLPGPPGSKSIKFDVNGRMIPQHLEQDNRLSWIVNPWRYYGQKHPFICKVIRESLMKLVGKSDSCQQENDTKKGIIISRKPKPDAPKGRNLKDVFSLAEILSQRYFPFTVVELEDLSVFEQIKCFCDADAVIACHGSGLAWLNVCKPNTTVVEVLTPYFMQNGCYPKHDFWMISQAHNLNHVLYSCTDIEGDYTHPQNTTACVDVDTISFLLEAGFSDNQKRPQETNFRGVAQSG